MRNVLTDPFAQFGFGFRSLAALIVVGALAASADAQEKRRNLAGKGDFDSDTPAAPAPGGQPGTPGPASVPKVEVTARTLPGAVVTPDPKLIAGAPFNTKDYFAMPSEADNAGPLVLDALSDFPEVYSAIAGANDPGVKDREQRLKAFMDFVKANPNPRNWNADALEQVVGPYRVTYAKLRQAHQKPECVIPMPIGVAGPRIYLKSCIEAVLVAGPLIYSDLARGDKDGAIEKFGDALRLSRDFQIRTTAAGGSVIGIMHQLVAENSLPLLLNAKSITAADLDKILGHLSDYRKGSINLLPEMIKTEYLNQVAVLEKIAQPGGIDELTNQLRSAGLVTQADQAGQMKSFAALLTPENLSNYRSELAASYKKMLAAIDAVASVEDIEKLGTELAKIQIEGLAAANRSLFDRKTISEIAKKVAASDASLAESLKVIESFNDEQLEGAIQQQIAMTEKMDWKTLATRMLYYQNDQGMMDALTAIRRWYVTKKTAPKDKTLDEICKEAGLAGAPLDIFAGKPMQMIWTQFGPSIYSVAHDFKDEQGKVQLKNTDRGKPEVAGDYVVPLAILTDPAATLQPGGGAAPDAPAGANIPPGQGGAIRPPGVGGSSGSGGRRGGDEGPGTFKP